MKTISRKEAKPLGLKHYFTGKPCKYGHLCERHIGCGNCVECKKKSQKAIYTKWRKNNPEKNKRFCSIYYKNNKEKIKVTQAIYYINNSEKIKISTTNWTKNNPDKVNVSKAKWNKNNSGTKNALTAKRRAKKLLATPKWANLKQLEDFYVHAKYMTDITGIKHHVDHEIPLQSKTVCGLHCIDNL